MSHNHVNYPIHELRLWQSNYGPNISFAAYVDPEILILVYIFYLVCVFIPRSRDDDNDHIHELLLRQPITGLNISFIAIVVLKLA